MAARVRPGSVVIVVPPRGFPGGALLSLLERLRRHGIETAVAAPEPGVCRGTGDVTIVAGHALDDAQLRNAAVIVVFDDERGTIAEADAARALLRAGERTGRVLAAVGEGVVALAAAGLLRGHEVATPGGTAERLSRAGALAMRGESYVASARVRTALEGAAGALADDLADLAIVHEHEEDRHGQYLGD